MRCLLQMIRIIRKHLVWVMFLLEVCRHDCRRGRRILDLNGPDSSRAASVIWAVREFSSFSSCSRTSEYQSSCLDVLCRSSSELLLKCV